MVCFRRFGRNIRPGRVAALHGAPPRMKETTMTDKQRAAKVLELLAERYPDLETHLIAESPWELLVATVLAANARTSA